MICAHGHSRIDQVCKTVRTLLAEDLGLPLGKPTEGQHLTHVRMTHTLGCTGRGVVRVQVWVGPQTPRG